MRLDMVAVNILAVFFDNFLYKERTLFTTRASYHISNCLTFAEFTRIRKFLLFTLTNIFYFLIHNVFLFCLLKLTLLYKERGISFPLVTSLTLLPCSDGKNSVVLRHLCVCSSPHPYSYAVKTVHPRVGSFHFSKLAVAETGISTNPWDFWSSTILYCYSSGGDGNRTHVQTYFQNVSTNYIIS